MRVCVLLLLLLCIHPTQKLWNTVAAHLCGVHDTRVRIDSNMPHALVLPCLLFLETQNTLENAPFFYSALMLSGLNSPRYAAGFGAMYLVGRVIYCTGYSQSPEGRRLGSAIAHLGDIPLVCMLCYTAYKAWPGSPF